ncbi:uncharacterized protein LOC113371096 [Ctenocephalides felis]|uniref:uncharacterized protein LOC113371096 n=1 Tax=Ctenocephalides felis TaxID=7515 RepID=UPI000E6E3DD6|nr:uncharacterized protein LOC113371096 [Ctenocephalides felis]
MINRIQRLFMTEYKSLDDMVLVESPFAETTKNGIGIRQVHIGLTPTKLIIAADLLPKASAKNAFVPKCIDPRTETLELVTVCGVECVTLSVYHRRKRQTLKAHFCNSITTYYELGGFVMRAAYWNLWCERVKYLNPDSEIVRSCSETSAASSSTCSTQYVLGKTCGAGEGSVHMRYCDQIFCTHGEARKPSILSRGKSRRKVWNERDVYLGSIEEIRPENYRPAQPTYIGKEKSEPEVKLLYRKPEKKKKKRDKSSTETLKEDCSCYDVERNESSISRFAEGVSDQCSSGLRLSVDPPPVERHSLLQTPRNPNTLRHLAPLAPPCPPDLEPAEIADLAVDLWEEAARISRCRSRLTRHKRRYALIPKPHLLSGLGPWTLSQGERYSLQVKRAVSCVRICGAANVDPNLLPSLPRRLLTASISDENLGRLNGDCGGTSVRFAVQSEPALLFWTTDLWYRPRRAHEAYREQRQYLGVLPHLLQKRSNRTKAVLGNYFKSKPKVKKCNQKWNSGRNENQSSSDLLTMEDKALKKVNSKLSAGCFVPSAEVIGDQPRKSSKKRKKQDPCAAIRKALKVRKPFNAWNFDSTMLAYQLTMTDRKLFLQLTPREIANVVWTQTSRHSPNLIAIIAFGHRVSCLVTTSIVAEDDLRRRARLIARFIYTAEKCHQIHNFQSCYNVLAGLQSPPCYRLRKTWAHVRKKHAQMHDIFEKLCKLYRDPRLPGYQRAFHLASRTAPYLPYLGHIISRLLDRLPEVDQHFLNCISSSRVQARRILEANARGPTSRKDRESENYNQDDSSTDQLEDICDSSPSVPQWHQYSRGYTDMDIVDNCLQFFQPILEDNRVQKLLEILRSIDLAQKAAMRYALKVDPEAAEFLYRARYKEDQENFLLSIILEP